MLWEMPVAFAILRTLQWVAFVGRLCNSLLTDGAHALVGVAVQASQPQFAVQAGNLPLAPTAPPMTEARNTDPTALGNSAVGHPISRHENNVCASYQRMRQAARTGYRFQLFAHRRTHLNQDIRPTNRAASYPFSIAIYGTQH